METLRGRKSLELDLNGLAERVAGYSRILLDLGTGDGRYVHHLAKRFPNHFIIGLDSCRENLREVSQKKLANMLFVIASAQELPHELNGLVSHISINFPWGSLLESLLVGDTQFMRGLTALSRSTTSVDVRLNGGALAEAGWSLNAGVAQIHQNMGRAGWHVEKPMAMSQMVLCRFPSTWAKRLAFGRDPRAMIVNACL